MYNIIFHKGKSVSYGEELLFVDQTLLPFDIRLESLETITEFVDGYHYPYAGMRIYMHRNNLGVLIGGFYLPMLMFSALSLISYLIKPEVVSISQAYIERTFFNSANVLKYEGF